jgi:hypothetical protein
LIRLNHLIKTKWAGFVEYAPKAWKKDNWITSRKPVGIVAQFGQNQPMAMNDHIQYERASWRESRDYSKARWLSYAAATHFEYVTQLFNPTHKFISFPHHYPLSRYRRVTRWRRRTDADIVASLPRSTGGQIYNNWHPSEQQPVNLYDLPLLDDDHREINIYDSNGYRIPRRIPIHNANEPSCGILADLTLTRRLFNDLASDDWVNDDEENNRYIRLYPQAFTRKYGYFQSNSVPDGFRQVFREINNFMARNADANRPVVQGVFCQGYNHIQHSLTERAKGSDLVRGQIGAALARGTANNTKDRNTYHHTMKYISEHLPHERVQMKLQKTDALSRAFCVEPVFVIDVQELKAPYQCGRYANAIHIITLHSIIGIQSQMRCIAFELMLFPLNQCNLQRDNHAIGSPLGSSKSPFCNQADMQSIYSRGW